MKHIFIVNPAAGKGNAKDFIEQIHQAAEKEKCQYEIYHTTCRGDARLYARKKCEEERKLSGDGLRFYVLGGDGSLNEVVNGIYGFDFAELAVIPVGTGNDFVRNFENGMDFFDIRKQINGNARHIDLIQYHDQYAVNMVNIGLDCEVVMETERLRGKPLMGNSTAYLVGIIKVLCRKMGINLDIQTGPEESWPEEVLLVAIANGRYCGGGFQGVPTASLEDGLLDVSAVKRVGRRSFFALIGKYRKGTHLNTRLGKRIVKCVQCETVTIKPDGEKMMVSVDGEILFLPETTFQIKKQAVRFSFPKGTGLEIE